MLLDRLPAAALTKTRLSVPPLGVDVFDGPLEGLILAEAEFASGQDCQAFVPPARCVAEVTADLHFTGGSLAHACPADLLAWLADYNVKPAG